MFDQIVSTKIEDGKVTVEREPRGLPPDWPGRGLLTQ
jgi:hypothetical protein